MDTGLQQLEMYVRSQYGLNFQKKLSSLEMKTKRRLEQLGCSYGEYVRRLSVDSAERDLLIGLLTVHETYFFREDNHLNVLCQQVVPHMIEQGRALGQLRIWSAACSTGEEPYSIAIALVEHFGSAAAGLRIIATDIDEKTLTFATAGTYSAKSFTFRRTPEAIVKKYFVEDDGNYRVQPQIRKMVDFRRLNLFDPASVAKLPDMDIVFCRNVLIYFDESGKQQVLQSLHNQMRNKAFLFMGHAENIHRPELFQTVRAPGTFYYQKEVEAHGNLPSVGRR